MLLWAFSLAWWLMVFWSRLIKSVWNEITKLNQVRAFCVALSAAITVIIASKLWLPVSSTQIAIWAIFWIWLFREREKRLDWKNKDYIDKWEIKKIILSWVVTLPVAWLISSITYLYVINIMG
jgi:PiT family inorganic phosphate transporter